MLRKTGSLLSIFFGRLVGQSVVGPDLAVRVGVGTVHHRPFVLKHLVKILRLRKLAGSFSHSARYLLNFPTVASDCTDCHKG